MINQIAEGNLYKIGEPIVTHENTAHLLGFVKALNTVNDPQWIIGNYAEVTKDE